MAVGDAYVFPGFLTPVLTQLFILKPSTTFLTCFCRDERRKYSRKKSHLNQESNSQSPGHESDTLTTEPPRRGALGEIGLDYSVTVPSKEVHKKLVEEALALSRPEKVLVLHIRGDEKDVFFKEPSSDLLKIVHKICPRSRNFIFTVSQEK